MTRRPGPFRLADGGQIDRDTSIVFRFNGRTYQGLKGDTVASALLASGVRIVRRSLKFHRPRGIFSCGVEEPSAIMQLGTGAHALPAARAPVTDLTSGLVIRSPAGWPHVSFDFGRILDLTAPLWAAGFYNKTFLWPSWHTYEPVIRRLAGLGRAPREPDPDRYENANLHCDILVVGGGLAGLRAALTAANDGARVILVEQGSQLGGQSAWAEERSSAKGAALNAAVEGLRTLPELEVFLRTTVIGLYDHGVATLLWERRCGSSTGTAREGFETVRFERLVLATGAIEQPLIFDNNDRPGIVLAGAAYQYLRRYGVAIGRRVVIATNNDAAYPLVSDLTHAGVSVVGIADTRHQVEGSLRAAVQGLRVPHFAGYIPIGTFGFSGLSRVRLGRFSGDGLAITASHDLDCDALAVSGGFNPALQLYAQAGGKLAIDERSGSLKPTAPLPNVTIVGRAARTIPSGPRVSPVGKKHRQWVDLLHDVTVADLELAVRENFSAVEHVKRYTTVGMAADQGQTSTVASLEILSALRKTPASELTHSTIRPPVVPVTLGSIAGREIGPLFAPYRYLPMHDWHVAHGAVLREFGEWRRPVVYLRNGETREQAVCREALAVRTTAGLFDGSSLGKIEIVGPDALSFLDRFYINDLTTLKPHRVRYGLMLRETGTIFDDGTVVKLADGRFLITTTSGNAARVGQWLEEWHQCEWPDLKVAIQPLTECWATLSLAGPDAREILSKVDSNIDLSNAAFPHLTMREGRLRRSLIRIYRVSYTGELTYEINVVVDQAPVLWETLMSIGAARGLQPFGLDALLLLRLEKGFLHLGADTDSTTIPDDVGWGIVAANKRADFIGKRSLRLPEHLKRNRLQLIGLVKDGNAPFVIGSHLRVKDSGEATDGWVTSAGVGVLTSEQIALAVVRSGRARIGESVQLYHAGHPVGSARIVNLPFYDAVGVRMNA